MDAGSAVAGEHPLPGRPPTSTASLAPQRGGRITTAKCAGHAGAKKSREPRSGGHRGSHSYTVAKSGAIGKIGRVTAPKSSTQIDRVAALVDRRLAAMERATEPPTVAELNAVRRMVDWLSREREIEKSRTLTTR
jgi:hypothetical protein